MAKAVFRPGEAKNIEEKVMLPLYKDYSPVEETIEEVEEEYTGPTADDLRREAEEYRATFELEKKQMLAQAQEEARLLAKEEARKLLTQPVVQISAEQRKTVSQINRESREKRVIHPIDAQKRYNSKRAVSKDTDERTDPVSDKSDVAVKSSLKKILDESDPHK